MNARISLANREKGINMKGERKTVCSAVARSLPHVNVKHGKQSS